VRGRKKKKTKNGIRRTEARWRHLQEGTARERLETVSPAAADGNMSVPGAVTGGR
jgi:hypothetical protein